MKEYLMKTNEQMPGYNCRAEEAVQGLQHAGFTTRRLSEVEMQDCLAQTGEEAPIEAVEGASKDAFSAFALIKPT